MGVCANCGEVLERRWKYCIACGTRREPAEVPSAEGIPGAIRPESPSERPVRRFDLPLLIGVALAVAGGVAIVILSMLFLMPHD